MNVTILSHLDEIARWLTGQKATASCPVNSPLYGEIMLNAIQRHEIELITLGHLETWAAVIKVGYANGRRGRMVEA